MLTIANWNLERALPTQVRAERVKQAISAIEADIWILTETHQEISPAPHFESVVSEEPERDSNPGECAVAIWSQNPIMPLKDFVSDYQWCVAGKIDHSHFGTIIVYATILPWLGKSWRGIPSKNGAAFSAALATYQGDWKRLQKAFPDALHIVAGDFNQGLLAKHYYGSYRNQALLEQALAACNFNIVTAGENDPIARATEKHACIDHICISQFATMNGFTTKHWPEANAPDKHLSDHFGVLVELNYY